MCSRKLVTGHASVSESYVLTWMLKAHVSTTINYFTRKALIRVPLTICICHQTNSIHQVRWLPSHHILFYRVSMFTCLLKNNFNNSYILCHVHPLPGNDHKIETTPQPLLSNGSTNKQVSMATKQYSNN
jgi:hypothetical protein